MLLSGWVSAIMRYISMSGPHYYLAYSAQSNSIEQIETYVNCLVNMGDFRTFMQIGEQINRYVEIANDYEEGENPMPQSFLNFLQRRKAYMLIKTMQFG